MLKGVVSAGCEVCLLAQLDGDFGRKNCSICEVGYKAKTAYKVASLIRVVWRDNHNKDNYSNRIV